MSDILISICKQNVESNVIHSIWGGSKTMGYALDPESIRAYRNTVMVFAHDLWREKDPQIRATLAMYLADAATTLARLEVEEARKLQEEAIAKIS